MVHIALMGHGVVGSGVVEVLDKNGDEIAQKLGTKIEIKHILDLYDFPDSPHSEKFIKDFNIILNDPEVKIVIETIGGLNPAYNYVKSCLQAGKSVVTSNKELIAEKGAELLSIAREKSVNLLFEASVGGGIPIIRPLHQCLSANKVTEISGILNGTTNYILTKMKRDKMSFEEALSQAQDLGYAEKDPTDDIEGFDSCRKICILASLAFGKHVYPQQVQTRGITNIALADIEYASSLNSVIKLIAKAKLNENGKLFAMVTPMILSRDSQLSGVDDVFNAITVSGNAIGDVMFYGKGAGKMPTASAVVADVMDCVNHIDGSKPMYWEEGSQDYLEDSSEFISRFYIRLKTPNKANIDLIKEAIGDINLLNRAEAPANEVAVVTIPKKEKVLSLELKKLKEKGFEISNILPIEAN